MILASSNQHTTSAVSKTVIHLAVVTRQVKLIWMTISESNWLRRIGSISSENAILLVLCSNLRWDIFVQLKVLFWCWTRYKRVKKSGLACAQAEEARIRQHLSRKKCTSHFLGEKKALTAIYPRSQPVQKMQISHIQFREQVLSKAGHKFRSQIAFMASIQWPMKVPYGHFFCWSGNKHSKEKKKRALMTHCHETTQPLPRTQSSMTILLGPCHAYGVKTGISHRRPRLVI